MKQLAVISETVQHFYRTLVLIGLLFIALGILVAMYPPALVVLASVTFVLVGLVLLNFAWRVYKVWKKLPGFLKK